MKSVLVTLVLLLVVISESHAQFWAKSNGRFGIGDENAFAKLQVNATSSFANPGIALLDSSANNASGGVLQFRSINYDDNHFNIQAKIGEYAYGQDSKLDFFWRDNLIMSIEGGTSPDRQLIYNPRDGIFRTGYLNPGTRGEYSVAMGYNNIASGYGSVALGGGAQATGDNSTALGGGSTAAGVFSTAVGYDNFANAPYTLAAGKQSSAAEVAAVAIGDSTVAIGAASHAIGFKTFASAHSSTATGHQTDATGLYSFSGGYYTQATNTSTTSFGFYSQATGVSATSLGYATLAAGENSVAMNSVTKAFGNNALSSGYATKAYGWESSAFGNNTTTRSYVSSVFGAYNDTIATSVPDGWVSTDPLLMVGNGLSNTERHNAFTIYKNGNILARNPYIVSGDPGSLPVPVSGAGTRLMWLPEKSAFRVGTVNGNQWNADNIGAWSFAGGYNAEASNTYSFSYGLSTRATAVATVALGASAEATAFAATAMGSESMASGYVATATGFYTLASGTHSTAMGSLSKATGDYATSIGLENRAKSYGSLAIGAYNDSISTSSNGVWEPTDPLIMVGNGTSEETRHNALTIYKNGNLLAKHPTTVTSDPGAVTLPASGSGTRLMWIPEKSAFRVGTVENDSWDAGNIGIWSFASGKNTKASGGLSTAMGVDAIASGVGSVAIGTGAWSDDLNAIALGYYSKAIGWKAIAIGTGTEAKAYQSLVIGSYNEFDGTSSPGMWVPTDPLVVVGNGAHSAAKSDALTIYKNANTDINGYTRLGKETESAPRIKMKELPLSLTGPTYNSFVNIPHGLSVQKILSVSVLVQWDINSFVPPEYSPSLNLRYNYYITGTDIVIQNNTPSGDCLICDQFVKILVTYKE